MHAQIRWNATDGIRNACDRNENKKKHSAIQKKATTMSNLNTFAARKTLY